MGFFEVVLKRSFFQIYVKKADDDRERYHRELGEYKTTDEYRQYVASQKNAEYSGIASSAASTSR